MIAKTLKSVKNKTYGETIKQRRAKVRTRDGIILIHLAEYPGHWIASPE